MFRARDRRRLLAGDNWYLRHSPTPSSFTSASHLHPAPVSLVSDLVKPAAMQPVTVTVPSSRRRVQETGDRDLFVNNHKVACCSHKMKIS